MNNKHKYFRNLRHQAKLEAKGEGWRTYWSHVEYYTKEPDTRDLREHANSIYRSMRNGNLEEAIQRHINWYGRDTKGRYMYFKKPEVPYTPHKVQTDPKYSKRRKSLCKQANRRVRQRFKQYGEVYQHNKYKKVFDVVWELD